MHWTPHPDALLWSLLWEDLDLFLPLPPRAPAFAAETARPPRKP